MKKKVPGRPSRAHFDLPISDEKQIEKLVSDPVKVAKYAFFPFLSFNIKSRRYRRPDKKKRDYIISVKERPIRVAAHKDTYIYHHYASLLSEAYERTVKGTLVDDVVVSYRSGKGNNIDVANDVFSFINKMGECVVFAADLKEFFETIDHAHLKKCWGDLLKQKNLPDDHFNVFRSITKYSYVEVDRIKDALGLGKEDFLPRPIFRSGAEYRATLKGKGKNQRGLVCRNNNEYGVPQGSPISALLSNISMREFDEAMAEKVNSLGGLYRRYSDDIIFVISKEDFIDLEEFFLQQINNVPGPIRENQEKRVISVFKPNGSLARGKVKVGGKFVSSRVLQYLGFMYDGDYVTIRSQTLSRYWRKVRWGVRAAKRRAEKNNNDKRLYKRKLYTRFSHLGRRNLHAYKRQAQRKIFDDKKNGIKSQFSRYWRKLQGEINSP